MKLKVAQICLKKYQRSCLEFIHMYVMVFRSHKTKFCGDGSKFL
eukprot:UN22331